MRPSPGFITDSILFGQQVVFSEKRPHAAIHFHVFLSGKLSVFAARNGYQPMGHSGLFERFLESKRMTIRNHRIRITLDHQDRRPASPNIFEQIPDTIRSAFLLAGDIMRHTPEAV